jgi:hypothetical protein
MTAYCNGWAKVELSENGRGDGEIDRLSLLEKELEKNHGQLE